MRVRGVLLCLLLAGCEDTGHGPEAEPAGVAVAESAPSPELPDESEASAAMQPALPPGAAQYRDAAMLAAQKAYEQELARCASGPDHGDCESSASAELEAAERAIRLEYEARLQEEAGSPDGG